MATFCGLFRGIHSLGLRIDHIDGLRDPLAYLNNLQERLASDESRDWYSSYVLVEKILSRNEDLPDDWPVSGTTGYDYLNEANGLFVEPEGARRIEEIYSTFIGRQQNFADVLYQKKKLVMNTLLGVEMRTLGRLLAELAAQDRYARELNRGQLIEALIEVTACLSVYRTYIRNMDLPPHATHYIEAGGGCGTRPGRPISPLLTLISWGSAADPESSARLAGPARGAHGFCDPVAAVYWTDRRQRLGGYCPLRLPPSVVFE